MPVDATMSEALAPVLRDLENSGTLLPDILDEQEQEQDFDGRVSAMLYGPDVPQRASIRLIQAVAWVDPAGASVRLSRP